MLLLTLILIVVLESVELFRIEGKLKKMSVTQTQFDTDEAEETTAVNNLVTLVSQTATALEAAYNALLAKIATGADFTAEDAAVKANIAALSGVSATVTQAETQAETITGA